jgi:hypothetical protein
MNIDEQSPDREQTPTQKRQLSELPSVRMTNAALDTETILPSIQMIDAGPDSETTPVGTVSVVLCFALTSSRGKVHSHQPSLQMIPK